MNCLFWAKPLFVMSLFSLLANDPALRSNATKELSNLDQVNQTSGQTLTTKPAAPITEPALWVTLNDYPTDTNAEGIVRFHLTISTLGRVIDCQVTSSSGSNVLDYSTCVNIVRRARFSPATNSKGEFVIGSFDGKMCWFMPN